ncbi:MAG: hypothetical protein GY909_10865 [Oligoflexia bacterium]|nr:hypothetical protein [Oligoflexia bacterium]
MTKLIQAKLFTLLISLIFLNGYSFAETEPAGEAFGHPGLQANWASAKNVQAATFYEPSSKTENDSPVWFTNAQGMLTEVFFPTIDIGQIKDSQILISDDRSFLVEEKNLKHNVTVVSPSVVRLENYDRQGRFSTTHTFFTLKDSPTIVDEVTVTANVDGLSFYLLTNPHLNNTGAYDTGIVQHDGFLFREGETSLHINSTVKFKNKSVGFVGSSDGYQDLHKDFRMDYHFTSATNGNIASLGEFDLPKKAGTYKFYVVYTFKNKDFHKLTNILPNYEKKLQEYENTWNNYLNTLKVPKNMNKKERDLYYRSLFTLKVHEDKANPGALIASLSIPWGEKQYEVPGNKIGGYHLIWPRDLYHVAMALLSAGEIESPYNALRFLRKIQYKKGSGAWDLKPRYILKEGAFPQNTWVSGEEYWGGLQLDQVGYPIHLFWQVFNKVDAKRQAQMMREFKDMIVNALDFIVRYGPWSQQERWEENFGISPSSFSVAASALYIGQRIFPNEYGRMLKRVADTWLNKPNDNIDTWTFTTNGVYGDGQYYLRVAGGSSFGAIWNPNDRSYTHVANSGQRVQQETMLDQGFLKLALLGLRPASDDKIKKSKALVDQHISVVTPRGRGWYRYSFDAYGEDQKGRLWPLLSSEHGRFAIERFRVGDLTWKEANDKVQVILDSYVGFANQGLMIPEQIFEHNGEGTGAATPLAWSHAEYIKLLWSRENKHNVENILSF